MGLNYSEFWDADEYVVVDDKTKPAIKWAANELKKRGKTVYYVDLSNRPEFDTIKSVGEVPDGIENAVIGLTTMEPADAMNQLFEKGVVNTWIHWRTDTPAVRELCAEHQCFTGRCPMMYLGSDLSIHGVHRAIAKLTGKY
ncbi:hypothetical protein J7W08_09285 [Methanococcoides orientis]|uniref:hypothetical protein n=1 Tax=Methanococcoides orientis TaxID=2822137 RepID=UPI001E4E4E3C|nr:hypothetical protein [Methanococcoides orientis]UGV40267.1 hypothetical protein J7W08_09285 [Methanococcoides orientis]